MYSIDGLRVPRAWFHGPKWKRLCGVREVPIADLVPAEQLTWHPRGKKILVFSFEEDLRELMFEEIRPGVYADWSDPREQLGLTTHTNGVT